MENGAVAAKAYKPLAFPQRFLHGNESQILGHFVAPVYVKGQADFHLCPALPQQLLHRSRDLVAPIPIGVRHQRDLLHVLTLSALHGRPVPPLPQ